MTGPQIALPGPVRAAIARLEACGYTGRVGYELFPLTDTKTAVKAIMENC